ncbi:MAG: hypothetical protein M1294_10380 [Firmicutes bacterium]|jgi:hypothetical protein|uniref:Uncharacterized protein n=1 Tax=Sulfobacillus thermosulfidooxidans (strain DSM 9293 / VKM B-1269 / AT-1) TaxID=929705 RepID=A0A1W1W731_SULTA|nr:hypothetical protein [Sulfobacillus thermosulfidooxidans]MCL4495203.1 hypothetical protein [Bacillota bacterium]MCL5013208.1 hypothetical protein [Bacillota bacterium]SMC02086.1 hypothetical protein SAMN00768000_0297 [Sulfobacillus thermosulfidooxidans DSM 9293]
MYRTRLRHWRQNRLVSIVGASVLWVLASGSALAASVPTMTSPSQPNVIRTGPGGYSYPPNSIFYIFQNYRGSNGVDVPYRQGQDQASSGVGPFGLLHVLYKHSTATSIVAQTVEYGEAEPFYNNINYKAWYYNPNLPIGDPYRDVTIVVGVNPSTTAGKISLLDGLPQGVLTAYAVGYSGQVPGWIASPNPYNCVWGGPG